MSRSAFHAPAGLVSAACLAGTPHALAQPLPPGAEARSFFGRPLSPPQPPAEGHVHRLGVDPGR